MSHRAVPNGQGNKYDPNADPKTWDWQPSKVRHAMRRNQLPRKCNDMCWAIALIIVVLTYIGFAISGAMQIDWAATGNTFSGAKLWKYGLQMAIASGFGILFALLWSCILRACAGTMVKLSIYVYLGLQVMAIVICLMYGATMGAVFCGISLLIHGIYFACVWRRIPMAEATLSIATKVVHRYSCVFWISCLFSILSIVYIFMVFFGTFGLATMTGVLDKDGDNSNGAYMVFIGSFFVLVWGSITLGYIVHAICAGVMGTWYFGTSRKRTVTDAVVRALTTSLGSISFAAGLVAIIKTLEMMAENAKNKAREKGDAGAAIMAACLQCLLGMIGDMLNYFNTLALVRVAVYGESFCTAAKRTMNMLKYRGMDQIINDDLSGMPVWLGCQIIFLLTVPCLFSVVWMCPGFAIVDISAEGGTASNMLISFIFSLCALFIPISILNVIPSFVQSLYVLWGDDPAAFDQTHPQEANKLKAAAWECHGYKVRYDDHRITGRS